MIRNENSKLYFNFNYQDKNYKQEINNNKIKIDDLFNYLDIEKKNEDIKNIKILNEIICIFENNTLIFPVLFNEGEECKIIFSFEEEDIEILVTEILCGYYTVEFKYLDNEFAIDIWSNKQTHLTVSQLIEKLKIFEDENMYESITLEDIYFSNYDNISFIELENDVEFDFKQAFDTTEQLILFGGFEIEVTDANSYSGTSFTINGGTWAVGNKFTLAAARVGNFAASLEYTSTTATIPSGTSVSVIGGWYNNCSGYWGSGVTGTYSTIVVRVSGGINVSGYGNRTDFWIPVIWFPRRVNIINNNGSGTNPTLVYYQYKASRGGYYYWTNYQCTTGLTNNKLTSVATRAGYTLQGYAGSSGSGDTIYINTSGSFINNLYQVSPGNTGEDKAAVSLGPKWSAITGVIYYRNQRPDGTAVAASANNANCKGLNTHGFATTDAAGNNLVASNYSITSTAFDAWNPQSLFAKPPGYAQTSSSAGMYYIYDATSQKWLGSNGTVAGAYTFDGNSIDFSKFVTNFGSTCGAKWGDTLYFYPNWILQPSCKVWNGSSWLNATPYVWNGSSWVAATAYVWNGSSWVIAIP